MPTIKEIQENTQVVPAEEVTNGDYLPGLDNGYVIESEETEVSTFAASDRYNMLLGTFQVITFNTANGDEAYLIVPVDMPVTIHRPE